MDNTIEKQEIPINEDELFFEQALEDSLDFEADVEELPL